MFWSAQERWEENFGISPSSFSVAATALILGEEVFPMVSITKKRQWHGLTSQETIFTLGHSRTRVFMEMESTT